MTSEERFREMAEDAMEAEEEFNDDRDDRAIIWAHKEIVRLRLELVEYQKGVQEFR